MKRHLQCVWGLPRLNPGDHCLFYLLENDFDELKEKYLDKHVIRCFVVYDESVLVKGFIRSVTCENSVNKFIVHVTYVDGNEKDFYNY